MQRQGFVSCIRFFHLFINSSISFLHLFPPSLSTISFHRFFPPFLSAISSFIPIQSLSQPPNVFRNLYERIGLAEGCGESEEGTFATFIHMGAVVFFNFMGFVFALGAPNVLPLVFANLCLAVPTTVIDWRRSHGRTPMHWLQLFNQAFMWMSMGVLLAAWMVCQMFIKLLEMKNASDKAEDQAAARRRQEEGNSFIMSDGNGGILTMNRIGDTDDFACSDGHTYTCSGGSSGYYGDYEKRY